MKTAMVISPHADDAAAFCGATLAKFADDGWNVILVRVTDDRKDSVKLSIEETIRKNAEELRKAADILGIKRSSSWGSRPTCWQIFPLVRSASGSYTCSANISPMLSLLSIPDGLYENNQDHVRVAQAVDEAFWVSCFDKHYPEHFAEGWNLSRSASVGILPASFPKRLITKKSRKPSSGKSWRSVPIVR